MIPADVESLPAPVPETAGELLGWAPAHGVLSLYLDLNPADRSDAWQIELRNGLAAVARDATQLPEREARQAVERTAKRLEDELAQSLETKTRGLAGFVAPAQRSDEERWFATQVPPRRTEALYGPVAHLRPLLALLDDGAPIGVAAVSSERVRLLDWRLGRIGQLHDWELELFLSEWRERKSQRPDPARGSAVSASGRDQYNQRLESNRERFATQTGELAAAAARERGWRELIVFGDERYARHFGAGCKDGIEAVHVADADLVTETTAAIEARVEAALPGLNRARERALVDRIKEAAFAEGRSALGVQETLQALTEGRVEHLVFDATRDYAEVGFDAPAAPGAEGMPLVERMIAGALRTGAAITPVEGESASQLSGQGGVAALLRY